MTTNPRSESSNETPPASSIGLILFAWLFVGIPLAWGVIQTIIKSMALFQ